MVTFTSNLHTYVYTKHENCNGEKQTNTVWSRVSIQAKKNDRIRAEFSPAESLDTKSPPIAIRKTLFLQPIDVTRMNSFLSFAAPFFNPADP